MLRRILPHPLLTLTLAVVWVLLNNAITPGAIVLGLILGVAIPLFTASYWPATPTLQNYVMLVEYAFVALWDILVANVQVAFWILFRRPQELASVFFTVPLDVVKPEAITVLAGTITMTPGTVSCDLASDGRSLLVHGLHVPDVEGTVATIKQRYERRLKVIFG